MDKDLIIGEYEQYITQLILKITKLEAENKELKEKVEILRKYQNTGYAGRENY